eukprot:1157648-Pelagomonas_calceolata.AAC.5
MDTSLTASATMLERHRYFPDSKHYSAPANSTELKRQRPCKLSVLLFFKRGISWLCSRQEILYEGLHRSSFYRNTVNATEVAFRAGEVR